MATNFHIAVENIEIQDFVHFYFLSSAEPGTCLRLLFPKTTSPHFLCRLIQQHLTRSAAVFV